MVTGHLQKLGNHSCMRRVIISERHVDAVAAFLSGRRAPDISFRCSAARGERRSISILGVLLAAFGLGVAASASSAPHRRGRAAGARSRRPASRCSSSMLSRTCSSRGARGELGGRAGERLAERGPFFVPQPAFGQMACESCGTSLLFRRRLLVPERLGDPRLLGVHHRARTTARRRASVLRHEHRARRALTARAPPRRSVNDELAQRLKTPRGEPSSRWSPYGIQFVWTTAQTQKAQQSNETRNNVEI